MDNISDLKEELRDIQRNIQSVQITAARTEEQVSGLRRALHDLQEELRQDFVSLESFAPVKNFVYGMIAVILTGFLGGVVTLMKWGN